MYGKAAVARLCIQLPARNSFGELISYLYTIGIHVNDNTNCFVIKLIKVFSQKALSLSSSPTSNFKLENPKMSHISEEVISKGEFVSLEKYTFKDQDGVERTWEVAGRTLRPEPENPDCVGTLAVLRRLLKYDCLILVKQYRPALKKYTLELPAGLINPLEKPSETASRELLEETGYVASNVKHISPLTALDPGLSRSTMKVVSLEVNGDELENHYPKQCHDDAGRIEVVHIPINELLIRLNDISEQGIIIDSRVYCFAIGLTVGAKNACYKQTANPY